MAMDVPRVGADASIDEVEAAFRAAGCVVVERLVSDETMDRMRSRSRAVPRRRRRPAATSSPASTRAAPVRCSRVRASSAHLAAHPAVARRARPRARRSRDELSAASHAGDRDRSRRTGAVRAPRPMGVRLLPVPRGLRGRVPHDVGDERLHRGERRDARHPRQPPLGTTSSARRSDETVPAEMPKGSVLFYLGSLYHGGGANRSAHARRGVNVGLHVVVVAPGGEPVPRVPARGRARRCPRIVARLAGYRRGAYALGYYGDLRDPYDAVRGEHAEGTAELPADVLIPGRQVAADFYARVEPVVWLRGVLKAPAPPTRGLWGRRSLGGHHRVDDGGGRGGAGGCDRAERPRRTLAFALAALFVGVVIAVDPHGLVPSGPARWTVTAGDHGDRRVPVVRAAGARRTRHRACSGSCCWRCCSSRRSGASMRCTRGSARPIAGSVGSRGAPSR